MGVCEPFPPADPLEALDRAVAGFVVSNLASTANYQVDIGAQTARLLARTRPKP